MFLKKVFPAFFCFFFLLAGCQAPQKTEKKQSAVRVNLGDEPATLDPRKARDLNSLSLLRLLFEGLTRVDRSGKAECALAHSVKAAPQERKYTFYLKDAKWSNGAAVTAGDFIYAWSKVLDPNFPSDMAFQLYGIKNAKAAKEGKVSLDAVGMRALDEKTLEVELEYWIPYFLELVSLPTFFPVHPGIDTANPHWAQSASSYVCNGPFRLASWEHHDRIALKKNDSYWDASCVLLRELEFFMVNASTALKMFEKKEIDWAGSPFSIIPMEAIAELKDKGILKSKEMLGTYFINVNNDCFPFQNREIRKAFALAIHRKEIVDHVTQGNQLPASGIVPLSFGLQSEPYFSDGDVDAARRAFSDGLSALHLDRALFPNVKLLYVAGERNHLITQALAEQWRKALGVHVTLEAMESKVYFDRLSKRDYQLAASSWIADFNDPINFLNVFRYREGASNAAQWENVQYNQLLQAAESSANPQERLSLLKKSEKILIEEMPILPVFHYTMLYLQQPRLCDVVLSSLGGIDFKWASLSKQAIVDSGEKR